MKILTSIFIILLFSIVSLPGHNGAKLGWATDLLTATLKELINQRPDLVQDIKSGKDEGPVTVSVVKDAQGRMSIWTEERRDINDNLIGKRKDIYTHYLTGEVNTITMEKYDSNDKLASKKVLKHYKDGTQPNLTVVEVPKGIIK